MELNLVNRVTIERLTGSAAYDDDRAYAGDYIVQFENAQWGLDSHLVRYDIAHILLPKIVERALIVMEA